MTDHGSDTVSDLITRLHHTAVSVRDFGAALSFFTDVVGMRIESEMEERAEEKLGVVVGLPGARVRWAMLELHGSRIELFRYLSPEGSPIELRQCDHGLTHIAFQVNNVAETCRRLRRMGYEAFSDPQVLRGGASRPVYVSGPEGIVVEFVEYQS